jgi:Protein of unknown function (DUF3795)
MSACGVLCSDCPAYLGETRGSAYQSQVVEAWHRIYGRDEQASDISCGGCLGPSNEVFYTSRGCRARLCCLAKGFSSCAQCPKEACEDLEEAQSVWDEVPQQITRISASDFETYARPYCDHRPRLAAARIAFRAMRLE